MSDLVRNPEDRFSQNEAQMWVVGTQALLMSTYKLSFMENWQKYLSCLSKINHKTYAGKEITILMLFPWFYMWSALIAIIPNVKFELYCLMAMIDSFCQLLNSILFGPGCGCSVGSYAAWDASGTEIDPRARHKLYMMIWSWKYFYGHSSSPSDSRRAVVSQWRKNVC